MSYLSRLFQFATARSIARTDLLGSVFGVLFPAFFATTGRSMPQDLTTLVATWVVATVVAVCVLRLLAAPYYVWKQDQGTIADLKRKIEEPERQRRQAFEDGLQKARADFVVEMRKYLYGFNREYIITNFSDEVLDHLNNHAVLFTHDIDIADMWRIFVEAFNRQASIVRIDLDDPDPDGFVEVQLNRNLNYFFQMRREAAKEIIAHLTYEKKGPSDLYLSLAKIRKDYEEIGRVEFYDQASLNEVLARRSQQGTAQKTQP